MRISDWSSDVCSSDLAPLPPPASLEHPFVQPLVRMAERAIAAQAFAGAETVERNGKVLNAGERHADTPLVERSEERRVGKECVSTCRSRWSPDHYKKNNKRKHYHRTHTENTRI